MTDNIWEEVAYWQDQEEQVNCDIIFKHELDNTKPEDLGQWFRSELKRRNIK